jgi:hypothetical protein
MKMSRQRPWYKRWAFNESYDIGRVDSFGSPMIRRKRLVQTPLFSVYLHHLLRPDADRDLHDHPWSFLTLILRGGYVEDHSTGGKPGTRAWKRFSVHQMRAKVDRHRIISVEPNTLTLVLLGRHKRDWGFYTPSGWVNYRNYLGLDKH